MSDPVITLALSGIGVALTLVGAIVKLTWWLGDRFDKVTDGYQEALVEHERRDQSRHEEILQRITIVETIVEKLH